ncbi:Heat shock 70 kDa protein BIP3 [Linum perenne]
MAKAMVSDGGGGDVIGIDLGTTFSCVAVFRNSKIEIIANDQGNRTTPSFVAFSAPDSERLIGEAARNQAALNPTRTIFDVKRLIGKKFDDPEVQRDLKYFPYTVVNKAGKPYLEVEVKPGQLRTFSPEEISAMVLAKMRETAESYLGKPVTEAVVTVPAYFNEAQRQATKDAGRIAGLNVLRIINEPTAGALAYGLENLNGKNKITILVYDLGGGTFDVSVLEIEDGVFRVLATGGDTHLGGWDFDQRVMDYFIDLIKRKYNKDISGNSKALGKLRKECERAKRALSNQSQVRVEIDSFLDGGMDFSEPLTRAKFEKLNMNLFKKTLESVKKTLEDGKIEKSRIDEIVLVGGSTRIPKLRQLLKCLMVLQGERAKAKDCLKLGCFTVEGIPPAPRGVATVEVTFEIDADGILNVTGKCNATGKSKSVSISSYKGNLTSEEVERMIREAEQMGEEDKKEKARIDARNRLEEYIYDARSALDDDDTAADGAKVEIALREASDWLYGNVNATKESYEEMMQKLYKILMQQVWINQFHDIDII